MAADRHAICNLALGYIGAARINSFDDGSAEADLCRDLYETAVREVLQDHPWNFAEAAQSLPAAAVVGRPDFAYRYALPIDCIAPRWLMTSDGRRSAATYRLSKRVICTDLEDACLVYTYRAPEQFFAPLFTTTLAYLMAHRLAGPLTEDDGKVEGHYKLYMQTLARARSRDSQQDSPEVIDTSTLIAWHVG
jgi:hypothetical protein